MENLSPDVFIYLLSFLDVDTLVAAARTCKSWREVIESKPVWQDRCNRMEVQCFVHCDARVFKLAVVESVSIIRAFRRFVTSFRDCIREYMEFLFTCRRETTGFVQMQIRAELYAGKENLIRRAFGLCKRKHTNLQRGIIELLGESLEKFGLQRTLLNEVGRFIVHLEGPMEGRSISTINVVPYLVWKTLRERWGHMDIQKVWGTVSVRGGYEQEFFSVDHMTAPSRIERPFVY